MSERRANRLAAKMAPLPSPPPPPPPPTKRRTCRNGNGQITSSPDAIRRRQRLRGCAATSAAADERQRAREEIAARRIKSERNLCDDVKRLRLLIIHLAACRFAAAKQFLGQLVSESGRRIVCGAPQNPTGELPADRAASFQSNCWADCATGRGALSSAAECVISSKGSLVGARNAAAAAKKALVNGAASSSRAHGKSARSARWKVARAAGALRNSPRDARR